MSLSGGGGGGGPAGEGEPDGARRAVGGPEAMAQLALEREDRQEVLRRARVLVRDAREARERAGHFVGTVARRAEALGLGDLDPHDPGPRAGMAAARGDADVRRVALAREEQGRALPDTDLGDAGVQLR